MRRKSDSDIVIENIGCLSVSVFFIVMGIFAVLLPLVWKPVSYDLLQTKEVVIEKFGLDSTYRGGSYHYIRTETGEKFNISGEYNPKQLKELLTKGTAATIKWNKNKPFWTYLAEEIYVDGECVVTYDNDEPVASWPRWLLGGASSVAGGIGLCFFNFVFKRNRIRQKKRDEKIRKKYGKS